MSNIKEPAINIVSFLILGIINNFAYNMMLSAAKDLIGNQAPAAVVLLVNSTPSFIIALLFPTFQHKVKFLYFAIIAVCSATIGFILAGFTPYSYIIGLIGVFFVSVQQGFTGSMMLSYTSMFGKSCLSAFSMGTGISGLSSSFIYTYLTQVLKIQFDLIIFCFAIAPVLFLIAFTTSRPVGYAQVQSGDQHMLTLTAKERFQQIGKHWLIYTIVITNFLFEYTMMQGVDAAIDYPEFPGQFYTFSFTAAQIGICSGRSSLFLFKIPYWALVVLGGVQITNFVVFTLQAKFMFITSFWGMLVYVGFMGLVAGLVFVNAVYWLQQRSDPKVRKFLTGVCNTMISTGVLAASGLGSLMQMALEKK